MTIQERQEYFTQYWNQRVLQIKDFDPVVVNTENIGRASLLYINESKLLLTDLRNISDEDAVAVGFKSSDELKRNLAIYEKTFYTSLLHSMDVDFLRSKGIATPWRNYSVEDLIEQGVLKLKP